MTHAPSNETMCELLEAWMLAQLPDPADPRAKAAAAVCARTFAIVFPPTIKQIWATLPEPPPLTESPA